MNYTYTPPPRPTPWPWIIWAVISMLLMFGGVQMLDAQAEQQEAYLAQKRIQQKRTRQLELERLRVDRSASEVCRDKYKNREVAFWWERSEDSGVHVLVCAPAAAQGQPATRATSAATTTPTTTRNPS